MDVGGRLNGFEVFPRLPKVAGPLASRADYLACREVMRAASKNYSFASVFFPAGKRHHVEALYALMRVGDDRVDVSHSGFASPLEAIDDWEELYWSAFSRGDSSHPILRAYLNTAIECEIPVDTMAAYFKAMRDDLTVTRFPAFGDLVRYMVGSAIPVGRAMTHILGVRPPYVLSDALEGADSLSIAMQLSNFWRDIAYDWKIQRIYLPQEDLERFGYREADLAEARINQNLVDLLEFEFARTERYYEIARRSVSMLASGRWAVMCGLEIYRDLLDEIRRNGYDVFNRKAGANAPRKLVLALKSFALTLGV